MCDLPSTGIPDDRVMSQADSLEPYAEQLDQIFGTTTLLPSAYERTEGILIEDDDESGGTSDKSSSVTSSQLSTPSPAPKHKQVRRSDSAKFIETMEQTNQQMMQVLTSISTSLAKLVDKI